MQDDRSCCKRSRRVCDDRLPKCSLCPSVFQLLQMILMGEFSDVIIVSLRLDGDIWVSIVELVLIWIAWSWTSISYHTLGSLEAWCFRKWSDEVCADEFPLKTIIVIPFHEDSHVDEDGRVNSGVVDVVEVADCLIDWECVYHCSEIGEVFVVIYWCSLRQLSSSLWSHLYENLMPIQWTGRPLGRSSSGINLTKSLISILREITLTMIIWSIQEKRDSDEILGVVISNCIIQGWPWCRRDRQGRRRWELRLMSRGGMGFFAADGQCPWGYCLLSWNDCLSCRIDLGIRR